MDDQTNTPEQTQETASAPSSQDEGRWFIVHTYSGHEDKVSTNIKQRAETMGFADKIFDIIVPKRSVTKVSQGKKSQVEEKIFPGYVLVRMILTDDTWILVRTTPGVTAFIGPSGKPTPISDQEVNAIKQFIEQDEPLYRAAFTMGEAVKITDGPFSDFLGTIESIDQTKGKLRVLVSIFGRETPVELDFLQVAKI
jgi:transcriptional antiterminator NusG